MENHQVEAENDNFAKFLREKETNMKTMTVIELFELVDEIWSLPSHQKMEPLALEL